MDKFIKAIIIGIGGGILICFTLLFIGTINATIFYFIWNHLAPIYFTGILPTQFIHIPWWHCFLFMYLVALILGKAAATTKAD